MASGKIRVVIADDEMHIRYVLKNVVQKEGMVVVGEAGDGKTALALFRQHKPDLLMLDINMPGATGDEVLRDVLKESPGTRVIMLTMVADAEVVKRCLEAGATNYILKSSQTDEIRKVLREVFPPS